MKFDKQNLLLYAVTDRSWLGEKTLFQPVSYTHLTLPTIA